jgi:hypothetical protein
MKVGINKFNNMTPKEKAQKIYNNMLFCYQGHIDEYTAKQCALIALRDTIWGYLDQMPIEVQNYWTEVKSEIEKL